MATTTLNVAILRWKEGEYGYCADLVNTGGNTSVPRDLIESYLEVQVISAKKDGRQDVIAALKDLQMEWSEVTTVSRCL